MPKKKIFIKVAGNSIYAKKPNKNSYVTNTITGTPVFGTFPDISEYGFPSGPIYLRYGEHMGIHRGFGLNHIWQERFNEHITVEEAEPHVVSLINTIIKNAEIFYEAHNIKRNIVFKRKQGTLILELKIDGQENIFYSIVTAIPNGNPHGTKIGQIQ